MSETKVPATAKKPADHRPKKNEAAPGDAKDIEFEHGDHTWVIPADAFDDIEIAELLEDGKNISVVRQILGPEQWAEWKDSIRGESGRASASSAVPFLEALFEAAGQGNSPASSGS